MSYLNSFLNSYLDLFMEMSPWLLMGFFIAGIIHGTLPLHKMKAFLGKPGFSSSLKAALFGVPLPLCSCGVIPAGIAMHKNGASRSAGVSFLISTPQTGIDSILVTYSMLGLPLAIIRPIVAFSTGIFGGTLSGYLEKEEGSQEALDAGSTSELQAPSKSLREILRFTFVDFLGDIAGSLIVGLGVAALIAMLVPDDFFLESFANPYMQMLIMLLASVPMYVCATASVPIAAILLAKGIAPGAALVFLMAGPATNAATIAVIRNSLGTRTFLVYLFSIVSGAYLFGVLINQLPPQWFVSPLGEHAHHHQLLPDWLTISSALLLAAAILNYYISKIRKKLTSQSVENTMTQTVLEVHGMTCRHCKMNVENNLNKLEFIQSAVADPDTDRVVIDGESVDLKLVEATIRDLGYEYKGTVS